MGRGRIAVLLVAAALIAAGVSVAAVVTTASPSTVVALQRASTSQIPGPPLHPAWPASGEAAVGIPSLGLEQASAPQVTVPIASLTKIMTVYLLLEDHPLAPGGDGPMFTMSPADVADYDQEVVTGETSVLVVPGEQLSERQLLEGVMVRSAGNFADTLARWDAGSVAAFVAKMNTTARALGLVHTHYADTSGVDPGSASTALDQLHLTTRAMAVPAFAALADQTVVTLPGTGALSTFTPYLGELSVVGVKSGFTDQAGGCDALAANEVVGAGRRPAGPASGGHPALVLSVVLGQQAPAVLSAAGAQALVLAAQAAKATQPLPVLRAGQSLGTVTTGSTRYPAVAATGATVIGWPGQRARLGVVTLRRRGTLTTGAAVGRATVTLGGLRHVVRVVLARPGSGKSLVQDLS